MRLFSNHNFNVFLCGAVLWGIGEGMYIYYHTIYLKQLGATPVLIGALFSMVGVLQMVVQTPAGYLADRFGRLPMLHAGWLTAVISTWIFALAGNLTLFALGLIINGLMAIGWPAQFKYIASISTEVSPGRALTMLLSFSFSGTAIGSFISSQVSGAVGFHNIYIIATAFTTASLLFIFNLRPQPVPQAPANQPMVSLSHNRKLLAFLFVVMVVMVGLYIPYQFSPYYLQGVAGATLEQVGTLGAVAGIGNVVMLLLFGSFTPYRTFLAGQVFIAMFALLMWFGRGMPVYSLAYFCLGGIWLTKSITPIMAKELVYEEQSGVAIGLAETVKAGALVVASFLAGLLYQSSPGSIYPFGLAVILLGMVLTLALHMQVRNFSATG